MIFANINSMNGCVHGMAGRFAGTPDFEDYLCL